MRAPLLGTLLFPLLLSLQGCGGCDVSGQEPLEFKGGLVSPDGTLYESSGAGADLLHFPPGRVYHLAHGLGTSHLLINPYVSFKKRIVEGESGTDPFAPNHLSAAAGNQVVIEGWNEEYIRIRNDTCAEFYVLVIASTSAAYSGSAGASSR